MENNRSIGASEEVTIRRVQHTLKNNSGIAIGNLEFSASAIRFFPQVLYKPRNVPGFIFVLFLISAFFAGGFLSEMGILKRSLIIFGVFFSLNTILLSIVAGINALIKHRALRKYELLSAKTQCNVSSQITEIPKGSIENIARKQNALIIIIQSASGEEQTQYVFEIDQSSWNRYKEVLPKSPSPIEEDILKAKSSSSWDRDNALYRLGKIGPNKPELLPIFINALTDSDSNVRSRAVVCLKAWGAGALTAVPSLIPLLQDKGVLGGIKKQASKTLKEITGQDYGYDQAQWQQWWDENKDEMLKDR